MDTSRAYLSLMILMLLLAGCTAAPMEDAVETEEQAALSPVP